MHQDLIYQKNWNSILPIGPKFFVGPHMTQGKFKYARNFNKLCPKFFDFRKNFGNSQKQNGKSAKKLLLFHQRENAERLSNNLDNTSYLGLSTEDELQCLVSRFSGMKGSVLLRSRDQTVRRRR